MMKKVLCLLCALLYFVKFVCVPSAQASEIEYDSLGIQPRLTYIQIHNCNIVKENNNIVASAAVVAYPNANKCQIKLTVQEKRLIGWKTIQTWTISKDSDTLAITRRITSASGEFRVQSKATVWCGTQSESNTATSDSIRIS